MRRFRPYSLVLLSGLFGCTPTPRSSRTTPASSAAPRVPAPPTTEVTTLTSFSSPDNANNSNDLAELQARLTELEQRVQHLEHKGVVSWSCQARCGTYQNDNEQFSVMTATGESAAEALDKLLAKCTNVLYTHIKRTDLGSKLRVELVPPTIRNSCTRN